MGPRFAEQADLKLLGLKRSSFSASGLHAYSEWLCQPRFALYKVMWYFHPCVWRALVKFTIQVSFPRNHLMSLSLHILHSASRTFMAWLLLFLKSTHENVHAACLSGSGLISLTCFLIPSMLLQTMKSHSLWLNKIFSLSIEFLLPLKLFFPNPFAYLIPCLVFMLLFFKGPYRARSPLHHGIALYDPENSCHQTLNLLAQVLNISAWRTLRHFCYLRGSLLENAIMALMNVP